MDIVQSSTNSPNTALTHPSDEIGPDGGDTVLDAIPVNTHGLDGGWFGKIITTAILLLGTFGNAMTVIILRRLRSGWSAMNVYLTALALSDTVMLYSGALPMWTIKVLAYDVYASHDVVCKLGFWLMSSSSILSSWLLVALTAQRAASVVWPHRVNVICTRHKSVVIVIVITAVCTLIYSHIPYGFAVVKSDNGTSERCTFVSADYQHVWLTVFVRVDTFVYSVVPCVCLLLSNAVLGWKLAVAMKDAKEKFSTGRGDQQDCSRRNKVSSVTVTIIIVSGAFVVITIPFTLYNAFFRGLYTSEDAKTREIHDFVYDFFFVFGMSNFAWNFYLYCLTGSKFRGEFKKIMFGCCVPVHVSSATASACVTEESQASELETHGQRKGDMESHDDF